MKPAAFVPLQCAAHDEVRAFEQISQFDEIGRHTEMAVIIFDLVAQETNAMRGALEPLGGAYDTDVVPHEPANFRPVLLDHHFLVGIGHPAFIP